MKCDLPCVSRALCCSLLQAVGGFAARSFKMVDVVVPQPCRANTRIFFFLQAFPDEMGLFPYRIEIVQAPWTSYLDLNVRHRLFTTDTPYTGGKKPTEPLPGSARKGKGMAIISAGTESSSAGFWGLGFEGLSFFAFFCRHRKVAPTKRMVLLKA